MTFRISSWEHAAGREAGAPLVHVADREALLALHEATATIPDAYRSLMGVFERFLSEARWFPPYVDVFEDLVDYREDFSVNAGVNAAGRVAKLELHQATEGGVVDLPEALAGLDHLMHLEIAYSELGSIPYEALAKLPNLVYLKLQTPSKGRADDFSLEWRLPHLQILELEGVELTPRFFRWMRECLPNLQTIITKNYGQESSSEENLPLLRKTAMDLPTTIRSLALENCGIDESQLEMLLLDVLPRCPALQSIDLGNNNIRSLGSLHRKLKADAAEEPSLRDCFFATRQLRRLGLAKNPITRSTLQKRGKLSREDAVEVEAVCGFLGVACTITDLGVGLRHHPSIGVELDLNRCGRYLVRGGSSSSFPPGVWPRVLEKVWRSPGLVRWLDPPDALFYFLRNGPVLAARNRELSQ